MKFISFTFHIFLERQGITQNFGKKLNFVIKKKCCKNKKVNK